MDSDIDRSLLSRPVTKLSRSTAVTTPNTICFRLGEPSVRSGKGERGQTIMSRVKGPLTFNKSKSRHFVPLQVVDSAKFVDVCSHSSWDIAFTRMGWTTGQHYTSEPLWTWSYKSWRLFVQFSSLQDFDSLYQKGLSVGAEPPSRTTDIIKMWVRQSLRFTFDPQQSIVCPWGKTLHVQKSVWVGTKTACVTGSMLYTSI